MSRHVRSHHEPTHCHRREEGSAFLIVVLLTLVVTAMGTTMLVMSNTDHQIAANERDAERALFASKAGLDYAYSQFRDNLIAPTEAGATFNSFAAGVSGPLEGQAFTGRFFDLSASVSRGQLFRIESTGTYNRASRTTELVFEIVPESMKYGYMAFNLATLHNHSGLSGPTFRIETTIFSNDKVEIPTNITVDGAIVAAGDVSISTGATITKQIFSNTVDNSGTVNGDVVTVTSVQELDKDAATWDRVDHLGTKYAWYGGFSTPGAAAGSGTYLGTRTSHAVVDGEQFRYTIFRKDGSLISTPDVNVTKYVPPPMLDYPAMKEEADKYDPTYFTSMTAAMTYLGSKKVNEVIGGKHLKTIRVGSSVFPEFLYVQGDFTLTLDPTIGADDYANGVLKADGFYIEGGIYASGNIELHGPQFDATTTPAPPNYYQFYINAVPYCYPALIAYQEPATGTVATWVPSDTPVMGAGSNFKMASSAPGEGFSYIHGATVTQKEVHLHHTENANEVIRFLGAELAWKVHNCDWFYFTYDPAVRCTQFLVSDQGSPEVVSYREVR